MATAHVCRVDCLPVRITDESGLTIGHAHQMYASEPSSAAGRYQWEQNRFILDKGRRAWRESGQGQSRACRVWDEWRRESPGDYAVIYGIMGRRLSRELEALANEHVDCAACEAGEPSIHAPEIR